MKKIFILLALIAFLFFLWSAFNLYQHVNETTSRFHLNFQLKGFETVNTDHALDAVKTKLLKYIDGFKADVDKYQTWYLWLNFLVTALTAGSTLVSSIQAARTVPSAPLPGVLNRFAIIVAVLTFCSTLANFGSTQFNERKVAATKSLTMVTQDLNDFYRKYDAAKSDEERTKIVGEYDEKNY